jgi:phosphonopyruvate decarboxylase
VLECRWLFEQLQERGVELYAGVPDSLLKGFCAYVREHRPASHAVTTANEGSALALAAGHHLASGRIAAVYLQNSGLGNLINPATSLVDPAVYRLPVLLLIGWRGEPGRTDEPQHVTMGRVTLETLAAVGIPFAVLPDAADKAEPVLATAFETLHARGGAYALVIQAGTLGPHSGDAESEPLPLSRERALELLLDALPTGACVVSTTGMASREVFEIRARRAATHDRDFLTVGSMGHCSQIALGIALCRPAVPVVCIDGDGSVLMHMGGLATIGSLAPPNLRHVLLNNAAHDSVGGQPTAGSTVDFCGVATACGYVETWRVEREDELRDRLELWRTRPGPTLLEIRVRRGSRSDLGRPTQTPLESGRRFMAGLLG